MDAKLTLRYDREGDVLTIETRPPCAEQDSQEFGDEVVARRNPKTGEVESLEILFFSTRLLRKDRLELPVSTDLHMAARE
ncbi:MAG: DUF2283 domain-containing protein [Polyangiaceae bacterium]